MAGTKTPFTTIRTEGGLLPTDLLSRVARLDASLPGTDPASYWLDPGERIAEAIARSWTRLLGAWETFSRQRADAKPEDPVVGLTRDRWLYPLLDELGWGRPVRAEESSNERGDVPIHLLGANVPLDRHTANVPGAAKHAPHTVVQDLLNRSDDKLWGLVSNGLMLRLLRDNTSMTRQAFVEFDLEAMFDGEVYSDFVICWLVCHCSRFDADRPEASIAQQWTQEAQTGGVRALAHLRSGVEEALVQLGNGFLQHRANSALRERIASRDLETHELYRQLLRLVYRLIFLFCAEDRGVLHDPDASPLARETYATHYSTTRMRERARRRGTEHTDQWQALRIVMRGLQDGCPPLGLPALGSMLWSDAAIPEFESALIANHRLFAALRALGYTVDGRTLRTVDWRNLGSEELGSVYESLLELHPALPDATTFTLDTAAGHERKVTGSYYTPTSLITELLNSALDPLLDERKTADEILALKVCDPACGSGHFLIAAAHRIARRLAVARTGEPEPAPDATRAALRDVIGRCIHGIDTNEMAVELCKVSLWLEALEPGKPLSFLDHRIACGNSLLGATPRLLAEGIPDDAFKPLTGDDKSVVSAWRKRNKQERGGQTTLDFGAATDLAEPIAAELRAIDAISSDDIEGVREKEARWRKLLESAETAHAKLVADAWCAAFVLPKVAGAPMVTQDVLDRLRAAPERVPSEVRRAIEDTAARYRFLHWQLTFPDVFRTNGEGEPNPDTAWRGGFDLICGNPPWERVKLSEREFFAIRAPEIANARNSAERQRAIKALHVDDPTLWRAFQDALRDAEAESHFIRSSGRFPLCGRGDVNTYAVFAEAMRDGVSPRGHVGCIVPSGIATDDTTKFFFRDLVDRRSIVSLYDFENRSGIFDGVHRSYKFCLLTMGGLRRDAVVAEFAFFAQATADLAEPERRFRLTPDDFKLLNPNTRTCPIFRTERDAEITKRIYRRAGVLIDESKGEDGNPWGIAVHTRIWHMAEDAHHFSARENLEGDGWKLDGNVFVRGDERMLPLFEAKMVHQYDHRYGDYAMQPVGSQNSSLPDVPDSKLADTSYAPIPRYWVRSREVNERLASRWSQDWLLGWRDICRSTDERTVISALIPLTAVGHSFPLAMPTRGRAEVLVAMLSSFALDFAARQKVGGTHLTFFIVEQLPVLPPHTFEALCPWKPACTTADWIRKRVLELVYTSHDMAPFARDLGHDGPPFRWDPARRSALRAELDAAFFHLYGLDRDETDYILDTFPIVRRKDEATHGEYRTKRLILEQYDAMAKAMR